MKPAEVTVRPELHLSETTAIVKIARFLRQAGRELDQRNEIARLAERKISEKYRKPVTRFRTLCADPRFEDLWFVVKDTGKEITAFRLVHAGSVETKRAFFCLDTYVVCNKRTRVMPPGGPMLIALSAHTLARMLERCSKEILLDLRTISNLLKLLLASALEAKYDEQGKARIGLNQFPDMVFVCCRERWRYQPLDIPALYSIVTYYEK